MNFWRHSYTLIGGRVAKEVDGGVYLREVGREGKEGGGSASKEG